MSDYEHHAMLSNGAVLTQQEYDKLTASAKFNLWLGEVIVSHMPEDERQRLAAMLKSLDEKM